ncbi:MAG: DUF975 family protein [Lachnospiraceae bacterium]|nr:DUF975 family protein [Lachnospiraceae bacterium]
MWTRKELKTKAKEALKRNYWKVVLVSVLVILLSGGFSYGFSGGSGGSSPQEEISEMQEMTTSSATEALSSADLIIIVIVASVIFTVVCWIVFAIAYAIAAFLYNPVLVGVNRFMLKSVDDRAEVKEIAYAFDHSYMNVVKTMFFKDLYVFLWTLLFVIPGVYKKYQYRMVPYIMAEHPEMNYKEALELSKNMMDGEKWHAFVLDLSFVLWHVLGIITCGILEAFYIAPYQNLTNAELYRTICMQHNNPEVQDATPLWVEGETDREA